MTPIAVDTNILVRLATGDNPKEYVAAVKSLESRSWRVFLTMALETEWVLRSRYGYAPEQFALFMEWMDDHPRIDLEQPQIARAALTCHRAGMDFVNACTWRRQTERPFLHWTKPCNAKPMRLV